MADARIQAEKDYVKGMKYKDIAEKYGVSINTVKSWKQRYGWSRQKGAPKTKSVHTKSRGAPKGNKNALGNDGGAPKGNSNAVTHGFFRKFLPEETLEIMEAMEERSPADLIWDQIQIQYAAIIRAQQIMHVTDKDEMIKELKKQKFDVKNYGDRENKDYRPVTTEKEYEFQFAWDRHATFLNAQSRAMSEFRSLIKQFCDLAHEHDERRLKLEQMRLGIEKKKLELSHMRGETENDAHDQGRSYEEALNAQVDDIFADEVDDDEEA